MRKLVEGLREIPDDVLTLLRHGCNVVRPADERLSDLYRVVLSWPLEDRLAWMSEMWRRHEPLIREGRTMDPFCVREMVRLRRVLYPTEVGDATR